MRHLYLHVPFCVRRCSYCDFSIAVRNRIPAREYVDTVLREVDLVQHSPGLVHPGAVPRGGPELGSADTTVPRGGPELGSAETTVPRGGPELGSAETAVPRGEPLDTLYLGGGTPSLLPAQELSRLITSLLDRLPSTPSLDAVEFTLEANPEDVTVETAAAWHSAGVNRVSLGAQSF